MSEGGGWMSEGGGWMSEGGGGWMREREKQVQVAKEPCVPKKEVCD